MQVGVLGSGLIGGKAWAIFRASRIRSVTQLLAQQKSEVKYRFLD